MRSTGVAAVVVLMILRTVARSVTTFETTIETTIEPTMPTTTCPPITCNNPNSFLVAGSDGCPICILETTTPETTTVTTTTGPTTCPPITCDGPYSFLSEGSDGCPMCIYGDTFCAFVSCGPDEECVDRNEDPWYSCVPLNGPTTEMTTFCPITWCEKGCTLTYNSGECPVCNCYDDGCMFLSCGPDEECVSTVDYPWFFCASIYGTTTPDSTPSTTPSVTPTVVCPTVTCNQGCQIATDSNGCTFCDCQSSEGPV